MRGAAGWRRREQRRPSSSTAQPSLRFVRGPRDRGRSGIKRGASGKGTTTAKQKPQSAKQGGDDEKNQHVIAHNRKARHNYEVLDTLECGIALVGSEVKSLRAGHASIDEAYGRLDRGEVWLVGCDIPEYKNASLLNHDPKRRRKLLLHRREIRKFASSAYEKNLTLVPLKMYFHRGRAKVLLGLCRGKKLHDKRETLKQRESQREIDRALRRR